MSKERPNEKDRYVVFVYKLGPDGNEEYINDLCFTLDCWEDAVDIYNSYTQKLKQYLFNKDAYKVLVGDSKTMEATNMHVFDWDTELPTYQA